MWLSKPVYEALPYYYVALGLGRAARAPLRRLLVLAADLHDRRRRQPRGGRLRLAQATRPPVAPQLTSLARSRALRARRARSSSRSRDRRPRTSSRHRHRRRRRRRHRLRRRARDVRAAHVTIEQLVLAELDDVAVDQHVVLHALRRMNTPLVLFKSSTTDCALSDTTCA